MRRDLLLAAAAAAVAAAACAAAGAPTAVTAVLAAAGAAAGARVRVDWQPCFRRAPGGGPRAFERAVLTVGLSLAVLVLGGLVLLATGLPLSRTGWAGCAAIAVTAGAAVAGRRDRAAAGEREPRRRLLIAGRAGRARCSRSPVCCIAAAVTTAVVGARSAPADPIHQPRRSPSPSADRAVLQIRNAEGAERRYRSSSPRPPARGSAGP